MTLEKPSLACGWAGTTAIFFHHKGHKAHKGKSLSIVAKSSRLNMKINF